MAAVGGDSAVISLLFILVPWKITYYYYDVLKNVFVVAFVLFVC